MSKRGPRFSEKEKLAILKEGEKNSVNSVCAKYGISDQTYQIWRYKAAGIQPRKQFSTEEKLQILEEAYQNGIEQVCAAYRISPRTYYRWKKLDFTKSLRRSFTEKEQLLIVKDATRDGISKASRKHKVKAAKVHGWAQQLGLRSPERRVGSPRRRSSGFSKRVTRMGSQEFVTLIKLIIRPITIGRGCWATPSTFHLPKETGV